MLEWSPSQRPRTRRSLTLSHPLSYPCSSPAPPPTHTRQIDEIPYTHDGLTIPGPALLYCTTTALPFVTSSPTFPAPSPARKPFPLKRQYPPTTQLSLRPGLPIWPPTCISSALFLSPVACYDAPHLQLTRRCPSHPDLTPSLPKHASLYPVRAETCRLETNEARAASPVCSAPTGIPKGCRR